MAAVDQTIKDRISPEIAAIYIPTPPIDQILHGWKARPRKDELNRWRIPWAVSATVFSLLVILSAVLFRSAVHQGHPTPNLSPAEVAVSVPVQYMGAGLNGKSYPGEVVAASSRLNNGVWVLVGRFSSSTITVYRSTDGGQTWASTKMTLPRGDEASSITLDTLNAQDAWFLVGGAPVAGQQSWYLYHTKNGGVRWVIQTQSQSRFVHGVVANLSVRFDSRKSGWITFSSPIDMSGTTVGVYHTETGGQNWFPATVHIPQHWKRTQITGPTFTASQQWTLTVTDLDHGSHQSYTFTSHDNGLSWRQP